MRLDLYHLYQAECEQMARLQSALLEQSGMLKEK